MTFQEFSIQLATRFRIALGVYHDDPGAAESIEAFGTRTGFSFQDTAEDIREGGVLRQQDQDSAEVISKEALISIGIFEKGG